MKTNTVLVAIVAVLLGGIGGYALNAQMGTNWGPGMMWQGQGNNYPHMDTSRMRNSPMMGAGGNMGDAGMGHMMEMMVSSEREFIEGMIPHHQEAIDTATEVLERGGTTSEIRTLAENIVAAQEQEIADMRHWYEDWYGEAYVDTNAYAPMMRDLSQLSGEALDRTFLEDMVLHHMGAIMMARSVLPYLEHQEIEDLTQAIVTSQSQEIQLMQQLLSGL